MLAKYSITLLYSLTSRCPKLLTIPLQEMLRFVKVLRNVKVIEKSWAAPTHPNITRPLRTKGNALLKHFVFGAVILRFLYKNAVQSVSVPSPLILGAVTQTGAENIARQKRAKNSCALWELLWGVLRAFVFQRVILPLCPLPLNTGHNSGVSVACTVVL